MSVWFPTTGNGDPNEHNVRRLRAMCDEILAE
jgi:hypothetical protein